MSKSKSNKPQNDIPEEEQALGGLYDEDEEQEKIILIMQKIKHLIGKMTYKI